jgi:hypothetical protein
MLSRSSLRLRRVALRFLSNRTFAAVALDSSPAFMTTRLSPSAYHATVQQAPAQRFDLESSVGVEALPKFSALCARCGFEPSFNCHQCDDVPLMTGMPLNDEPWFPNGGSGTTFVQ